MADTYVRDPVTGQETTVLEGHYEIKGNFNVRGSLTQNGSAVGSGGSSGTGSLEVPAGAVNGSNADFVFSVSPILVFRNGVMESRRGTINGNTFTFDSPPETGDEIEGLV